ncbi:chalcone isomerase family protein [Psychrobium sp. 1_MG-2023]|uniref:chalcone isomerase family protein n=1 Tax=Psychrobium sp. 1_MG-2023 TaxID=3062624 RepID=UPI000C342465|nr:chalcone isomerase family protein [Psychrobium sp. 1_MG-2023]MDP2562162.1 chalcone isomerase family protein [Psychrobium sp. 1_MG-2023]PKF57166.1 hypothetical protein CW748_07180 [Alteromonadales bacterium alter-6D02]
MFKGITAVLLFIASHSLGWANQEQPSEQGAMLSDYQSLDEALDSAPFIELGETTFSILFWDLYQSRLLTTSGRYPISAQKEMLVYQINYQADISSDDLIKRTVEQWQHLNISPEVYTPYLAPLKTIWPDIVDGDNLALLMTEQRSTFFFNGKRVGAINDAQFGQLFIDIWLSENTSQPKLRAELLGDNND